MNKDVRKYIAQCALCHREKVKIQAYPLQMTEIPVCPFDKIAIDLVTQCVLFRQQTHSYHHRPPQRMARSISNT